MPPQEMQRQVDRCKGGGRTSHATNKATPVATMPVVRTRTQGIKRREAETNVAGRHEAERRC